MLFLTMVLPVAAAAYSCQMKKVYSLFATSRGRFNTERTLFIKTDVGNGDKKPPQRYAFSGSKPVMQLTMNMGSAGGEVRLYIAAPR